MSAECGPATLGQHDAGKIAGIQVGVIGPHHLPDLAAALLPKIEAEQAPAPPTAGGAVRETV